MLKCVFVIFCVFCKLSTGFEISELQEFGRRGRNLSLELFNFTERDTKGSVVLAPYTIWNLISLIASTTSDESWKQFYSVMGISKRNYQNINSIYRRITNSLSRKNAGASFETKLIVFYDANLNLSRPFKRSIVSSGAQLRMLSFEENASASRLANEDMRLSGDLKLKRMFTKADFEDTSMIVSGVVEFKGDWSLPFDESNTIIRDGYNGSVYMMRQRARVYYSDIEMLRASVMQLTYGEIGDFSMLIIRPHEKVKLHDVIRNFAEVSVTDIFDELYREGLTEMDIELPKFSITSVLVLNNPFKSMGILDVFVPEQANFSELSTSEDMYIYNFEHRAVLSVSETGTVARACTPANLAQGPRKTLRGTALPFLFLIVHGPSMSVAFCGKYGE